ncbi:MAG: hypothetical protein JXB04_01300 [Kiritimatiellae bacterium]|nr:hypothetical protein [Kiritimatiellia bacterium]
MCPAAADTKLHGKNRGANGGRYCWRVPDTLRDGKPQGSFGQKLPVCSRCEFYLLVKAEEGKDFTV